jgi:hypothetical protein
MKLFETEVMLIYITNLSYIDFVWDEKKRQKITKIIEYEIENS